MEIREAIATGAENIIIPGMHTYRIGFFNTDENHGDETEFDAESLEDLQDLYKGFCQENNLPANTVDYVDRVPKKKILCLDLETTGINIQTAEILQFAAIDGNGKEYMEYYKPSKAIEWTSAQSINGISPEMVADKAPFEDEQNLLHVQRLIDEADILVGYNQTRYDLPILERYGITIPYAKEVFDVMLEFANHRRFYKEDGRLKWFKLREAAEYFGYDEDGYHDALEDIKATMFVYRELKKQ